MPTWFKVKKIQKFTHSISNNKTVKENGVVSGQKVNFLERLVNTDKINWILRSAQNDKHCHAERSEASRYWSV